MSNTLLNILISSWESSNAFLFLLTVLKKNKPMEQYMRLCLAVVILTISI